MPPSQHPPSVVVFAMIGLMALFGTAIAAPSLTQEDWDHFVFLPLISGLDQTPRIFLPLMAKASVGNPTPTPEPVTLPNLFGLNIQSLSAPGQIQPILDAGSDWLRLPGLRWADVEPAQGDRNWPAVAGLEADLRRAAEHALTVTLIVQGTPPWAQKFPGISCGPMTEDTLDDFGNFMYDVVTRYSAAPYHVKIWEIWNEPDVARQLVGPDSQFGCWGEQQDPTYGGSYYGKMLKIVYPRIKAADPDAQVLVGGLLLDCDPNNVCLTSNAPRFLEGILAAGGGPFFDGISFHAYDYYLGGEGQFVNIGWNTAWDGSGPVLRAKADFIRDRLAHYDASDKLLLNTELALLCDSNCGEFYERTKASYVAQSYAAALAAGLTANVWYDLTGSWRNSGLLFSDGLPRPAYHAFQFAQQTLDGLAFQETLTQNTGVFGYAFFSDQRRVWLLWSQDGVSHPVDLPEMPIAIYDVEGASQTLTRTLTVGLAPRYITFEVPVTRSHATSSIQLKNTDPTDR